MRAAVLLHSVGRFHFGVGETIAGMVSGLVQTQGIHRLLLCHFRDSLPGHDAKYIGAPWWVRCRAASILWEQAWLARRLKAENTDVVHAPAYVAPLNAQVATIVTLHDLFSTVNPEFCRPRNVAHHRALLGRSLSRAVTVITPSHAVRQQALNVFNLAPERVTVVQPGVADYFFDDVPADQVRRVRSKYGLPERYFFWLGNLEPKKNVQALLKAYKELGKTKVNEALVMAGGRGWGRTKLDHIELSAARWLGYVPPEDRPALYRGATALVFPSLAEGFGLPVLEALASGTPVIASPIPAAVELGSTSVRLIDPTRHESLVEAMLKIARERQQASLEAVRDRPLVAHLTWATHGRRLWRVYQRAFSGRPESRAT